MNIEILTVLGIIFTVVALLTFIFNLKNQRGHRRRHIEPDQNHDMYDEIEQGKGSSGVTKFYSSIDRTINKKRHNSEQLGKVIR